MDRLRLGSICLAFICVAIAAWPGAAMGEGGTCSGEVIVVGFDAEPLQAPADKARTVLAQPQVRVYEGDGWSNLSITQFDCLEDAQAALPRSPQASVGVLPKYAVFPASSRAQTPSSDRVPATCTERIYMVGMYTVTDPVQYAIYAQAMSSSGLARSYGVTIPFGGNTPLAVSGGAWPDNTTFNLTQWPCVEALEGFLLGPEFVNDILPLREGAAVYNLTSFKPAKP